MGETTELVSPAAAAGEQPEGEIEVGQWHWLRDNAEDNEPLLVCVTKLGSNFAELTSPCGNEWRVHFDDFYARCTRELQHRQIIADRIGDCRGLVAENMRKVAELTTRLGVGPRLALTAHHDNQTTALAVCSGTDNIAAYKTSLVRAREEELPALFKKIEDANRELAQWMIAETLPLQAQADGMKDCVEQINDRIFNVELYAGLVESVEQVKKGKPAEISDKLHLMQRRAYMDEECVAGYRVGGVTCETIQQFDRWLSRRENFDRILPFSRCAIAFRVRRTAAERDWEGSLSKLFVNISLAAADKRTFLYIRNGQQLFRLETEIEFGPKLFPDQKEFDLTQPLWARMFASSVDSFITDGDYQERRKKEVERKKLCKKWRREHPKADSYFDNPHRDEAYPRLDSFKPFNPSCVYFDEMKAEIENQMRDYNRIAVILQGLFDRSQVLHPHPPFRLWTPEGFSAAVKLVYDNMTLTSGDPPDFERYRRTCNASLAAGCVTVGQEDYWEQVEAVRENKRRDSDYRHTRSEYRPTRVRPCGNPGPGHLAVVAEWRSRSRRAKFVWERDRRSYRRWDSGLIPASLLVPDKVLLNCDAYNSGDFRQFYSDCRTRSQYLRWAPLLLAAEEYQAGNLRPGNKKEGGDED